MDVYNRIKEQRNTIVAPVDTMGCGIVPEVDDIEVRRYQILVSLLLSSQTKDAVTNDALNKLNAVLGRLTGDNVCRAPVNVVKGCISKVGFHNRKLVNLLKISEEVRNKKMPDTLVSVLKLPGIGRKMAYLYLSIGCGKDLGIGVDTHVQRISNRIGLVRTRNVEETRKLLENSFVPEEWFSVNKVLVGFGQTICKPVNPKCDECYGRFICPSSNNM